MSKLVLINDERTLTEDSKVQILEHTQVLECACPQHLLKVLDTIQAFQEYETSCIIRYPKDQEIHSWLLEQSKILEKLASETIVELMRREGILDEKLNFCTPPKLVPA